MTAMPPIVDRETWCRERRTLLDREKTHTGEGDAIAAVRRRLPMTEVDATATLVGPGGPRSFLDVFEGRDQLIVYKHMWHPGAGIEGQCVGCTASIVDVHDVSYLNHRGVSFAVFCEGPWDEIAPFREFMGYTLPWYSMLGVDDDAVGPGLIDEPGNIACYLRDGDRAYLTNETVGRGVETIMLQAHLLDLTAYGRQESWEDSPPGWPQHPTATWWQKDGRPVPQWTRLAAAEPCCG
ncbi:DUF899 domain-containing protein [Kribbella turkmenica]|uniref:DUF899 domain-containing protein n=1 Tax=Kribbella turkmenica TaxID=2530375 RepID=A0A4R4WTM6_9ACTN|nr:DUF899 family protein [Kribbella turkmenica]TDD21013.1 DUF899 domain-containing protein [Kribbella turkmenica]